MNASTDSRQGHNIVPKGQNDKVLKTLIQIKRKYYIEYISKISLKDIAFFDNNHVTFAFYFTLKITSPLRLF